MQIAGILETALYCRDVAEAAASYQRLLGFPVPLASERLAQEGVPVGSIVDWGGGARSLYFRDSISAIWTTTWRN